MKTILSVIALLALWCPATAQRLPLEMSLSGDGRMLMTGGKAPKGFYDSAVIRNVYLEFSQPNYWQLLKDNYATRRDLPATMIVDGVTYDSVGVHFKGQTSYGQFQNSDKKSFNITLDYIRANQNIMGYSTLNFHNAAFDATFMREVFYQHQIRNHIPAAKSNYVRLFINGQDWGLYPNVQQLNKTYLREWFLSNDGINWRADRPDGQPGGGGPGGPGWGDGTAALNYLGPDTAKYKTYYTLKSSDQEQPWQKLVSACDALNNTPIQNLPDVLPSFLDVDRTLWLLACEIAFCDDDSYVFKGKMDYYLYYEPETGRITPLEYDANTVMESRNQAWSPFYNETKVNYPLLNRILAVPQWRQRYLAHMRTIIGDLLDPVSARNIIDRYKAQIDTIVQRDPKKIYSYNQFVTGVDGLKNFIVNRRNVLLNNPEVAQTAPEIHSASYFNMNLSEWTSPSHQEEVIVNARVTSANGISSVRAWYAPGLVGNCKPVELFDDGMHGDGAAMDGIFGGRIPGHDAGSWVRFYIEAVSANTAKSVSYLPAGAEHNVYVYIVKPPASRDTAVVINELMASNSATSRDEAGQYDDWIELYNRSSDAFDLSGHYLTDNPTVPDKWKFPDGSVLPAGGYMIVWADEEGSQGPLHANFKLAADGEMVYLLNPSKELVDSVSFGPQVTDRGYARVPNGSGPFRIQNPTFAANNNTVATAELPESAAITLSIHPHPMRNSFILEHTVAIAVHTIALYDLTGRLCQTFEPVNNRRNGVFIESLRLDRTLPSGTYILRILTAEKSYGAVLVVTR